MTTPESSPKHITHRIGGKPWTGTPERQGDVYDPATGVVSGRVDFASSADMDAAVAVAKDAFATWRHASLAKRPQVLFAFRRAAGRSARTSSPRSSPPSTARCSPTRSAR